MTSDPSASLGAGLRLFIVSDIHVTEGQPDEVSHVSTAKPRSPTKHPFDALLGLIDRHSLRADVLFCGGDLANAASPAALEFAWKELQVVGDALGGAKVIGTAGNHDVDWKLLHHESDPLAALRALRPVFPTPSGDGTAYWSHAFEVHNLPGVTIVNLNTSGDISNERLGRAGVLTDSTLDHLDQAFGAIDDGDIRILLCHHHPYRHGDIDAADYSELEKAPELLNLLQRHRPDDWIVVHGHKHHPRLTYSGGEAGSPVILAAGSMARSLYKELQTEARNQVHLLHLFRDAALPVGSPPVGRFQSWDFSAKRGWLPAAQRSGLPAEGGLGSRTTYSQWAQRLADFLTSSGETFLRRNELVAVMPEFHYVIPRALEELEKELLLSHGIETLFDDHGQIAQIGRPPSV